VWDIQFEAHKFAMSHTRRQVMSSQPYIALDFLGIEVAAIKMAIQ